MAPWNDPLEKSLPDCHIMLCVFCFLRFWLAFNLCWTSPIFKLYCIWPLILLDTELAWYLSCVYLWSCGTVFDWRIDGLTWPNRINWHRRPKYIKCVQLTVLWINVYILKNGAAISVFLVLNVNKYFWSYIIHCVWSIW